MKYCFEQSEISSKLLLFHEKVFDVYLLLDIFWRNSNINYRNIFPH